jgi:hypothetical protein
MCVYDYVFLHCTCIIFHILCVFVYVFRIETLTPHVSWHKASTSLSCTCPPVFSAVSQPEVPGEGGPPHHDGDLRIPGRHD